ncbi:MAG: (deoxy)nucleoside triphosphate pyrophosphohydrolase [Bacillota bacterium]|jgi:8-oxo-dGTP diphosphatase
MSGRILPVTAALLWRETKLLLAQRLPEAANGGLWELPGGKLEFGENPEQCLYRELQEEMGLEVVVGRLHGVFTHLANPQLQILLLVYHCHPGKRQPETRQCQAFCWVTPQEAQAYDLTPLDRQIISGLVAGRSVPRTRQ